MKRGQLLISLLLLMVVITNISSVLAVDLELSKSTYEPRETLLAELNGNFITLELENILLYKEGTPRAMPIVSDLIRQGDTYYFYALLPNQEGNFTLTIEGAEYTELGFTKTDDVEAKFIAKRTNNSALQINPGFVSTKDFEVTITALNTASSGIATLTGTNSVKNYSLIEDNSKTLSFSTSGFSGETTLEIQGYSIPVFITQKTNTTVIPPIEQISKLNFNPRKISGTVIEDSNYFFKVLIENTGELNLTNISFASNINAQIKPGIINMTSGEKVFLNITIPIPKDITSLNGTITALFEEKKEQLNVALSITKNETEVNVAGSSYTESLACVDIGGNKCTAEQDCSGERTNTIDGSCCIGECVNIKSGGSNWWIGVIIIIIVLGLLGFLFWKAKKNQVPKSPREILGDREKNLNLKTATPTPMPRPVTGNLTKG